MRKQQEKQSHRRKNGKGPSAGAAKQSRRTHDRPDRSTPSLKLLRPDSVLLYGRNSVEAALENRRRECLRLLVSEKAHAQLLSSDLSMFAKERIRALRIDPLPTLDSFSPLMPSDAPHQGLILEVRPLSTLHLDELALQTNTRNIILMLDQVTDPHNVGACMRSAAAFGARALITQDRNSPQESGVLARSAAGGLEALPWHQATNLAQTLEALKDMGYWSIGLDGQCDLTLRDTDAGDNIVIVMGSEGKGLRPLIRKHCDLIAKIPMSGIIESLNVSNAAAIALYELAK